MKNKKIVYLIFSFLILMNSLLLIYRNFYVLPDKMPTHIGITGKTSGSMSKNFIFSLPALQLLFFIFYFIKINDKTIKFFNFPYKKQILSLDKEKRETVYPVVTEFLYYIMFWVNLLIYFVLNIIIKDSLKYDVSGYVKINLFLIVILLLVLIPYHLFKIKRKIE